MAKDAILVTTAGKTLGAQVVSVANQLRGVKTGINDIANIFSHLTDGVADYAQIEIQLGLIAGDGVRIYNLINTLQTQINGSTAVSNFSTSVISST